MLDMKYKPVIISGAMTTTTTTQEPASTPSLILLQPFEDQEETEIDEEYWRKYPDLRPGSMARELTRAEADILHAELTEAVSTFGFKDLPTWSCPSNIHGVCGHKFEAASSQT